MITEKKTQYSKQYSISSNCGCYTRFLIFGMKAGENDKFWDTVYCFYSWSWLFSHIPLLVLSISN